MQPPEFIGRFSQYARRHGFRATLSRIGLAIGRLRKGRWHVLLVCDLDAGPLPVPESFNDAKVERVTAEGELSGEDGSRITSAWNPEIVRRQISERFALGAALWLFKMDGQLAAYGWTIIGRTIEPHYFPLGPNEAHLFDYFVFPEFRGRRINPALVNHVLTVLAAERRQRAFIEAAEWNTAQLSSLGKTPFTVFGRARKYNFFGKTVVFRKDK